MNVHGRCEFSFSRNFKRTFITNNINKSLSNKSLSVIIENRWDINYIQTLPAQIQSMVLREKVFTAKKYTQNINSIRITRSEFELPDHKNIGKLSLKYELLFLDQANLSSVPFQILILQYPIPRASLSSSPSPSNFTLANRNPSSTQPSSCSSSVSPFCLTQCDTTGKLLDILNQMLSQANQIYYQTIYKSNYLIGQTSHLSKN